MRVAFLSDGNVHVDRRAELAGQGGGRGFSMGESCCVERARAVEDMPVHQKAFYSSQEAGRPTGKTIHPGRRILDELHRVGREHALQRGPHRGCPHVIPAGQKDPIHLPRLGEGGFIGQGHQIRGVYDHAAATFGLDLRGQRLGDRYGLGTEQIPIVVDVSARSDRRIWSCRRASRSDRPGPPQADGNETCQHHCQGGAELDCRGARSPWSRPSLRPIHSSPSSRNSRFVAARRRNGLHGSGPSGRLHST